MTAPGASWPVVELRQYTLVPGARETLIDLFESYLVDAQAAVGMPVIGQFRDLDDPDRFVWMRGFSSMASRREALRSFYFGPTWQRHRGAANATMVDSDDVLLLRPVSLTSPHPEAVSARPGSTASLITVTVLISARPVDDALVAFVRDQVLFEVASAGGEPIALYVTEDSPNDFPELPVRADRAVVWLTRLCGVDAAERHRDDLAAAPRWRDDVRPRLQSTTDEPLHELCLQPTARSWLR